MYLPLASPKVFYMVCWRSYSDYYWKRDTAINICKTLIWFSEDSFSYNEFVGNWNFLSCRWVLNNFWTYTALSTIPLVFFFLITPLSLSPPVPILLSTFLPRSLAYTVDKPDQLHDPLSFFIHTFWEVCLVHRHSFSEASRQGGT